MNSNIPGQKQNKMKKNYTTHLRTMCMCMYVCVFYLYTIFRINCVDKRRIRRTLPILLDDVHKPYQIAARVSVIFQCLPRNGTLLSGLCC